VVKGSNYRELRENWVSTDHKRYNEFVKTLHAELSKELFGLHELTIVHDSEIFTLD